MSDERRLLIRLESRTERESLRRFLQKRGCEAAAEDETTLVLDDCEQAPPGLGGLAALVEDWRCADRVAEAVLELDGRRTILRTEV